MTISIVASMKILIVEDEIILARVLEKKFQDSDFDVRVAFDGVEALVLARKFMPDIILLDLILPKKDGFKVLKELKVDPVLRLVPVIVSSNLDQEEDIKKALKLGADDYFVKAHHPLKEVLEKVKERLFAKSR